MPDAIFLHIKYHIGIRASKYLYIDFSVIHGLHFLPDVLKFQGYVCMPGTAQIIHEYQEDEQDQSLSQISWGSRDTVLVQTGDLEKKTVSVVSQLVMQYSMNKECLSQVYVSGKFLEVFIGKYVLEYLLRYCLWQQKAGSH